MSDEDEDYNRIDTDDTAPVSTGEADGTAPNAVAVLDYLAKSVVQDPDAVEIDVDDRGRRVRLTVTVGDGDMGRVIGRRGRIANAIRTVVRAAATKDEVDVEVEFED